MKYGIDAIGFYTPNYYLDLATLAKVREIPTNKFYEGLGQYKMSMTPPNEDIVTMAANAAEQILTKKDKELIDTLIFATESGLDYSKSAGTYVHKLLQLPSRCRIIELKQACYAGTFGLQTAIAFLKSDHNRKILLITSDITRYGLNTAGESSQGAGAVAMLLSHNPRILNIEPESGIFADDVMDFWRPNYQEEAIVFGKYSCDLYMRVLEKTWKQYADLSNRNFNDHKYFCYHVSVPKLVEKAHKRLVKFNGLDITEDKITKSVENSLKYNREVGNCYTAALYISLLSLLENTYEDLSGERIGLYSYGSGCVGEFFSATVSSNYKKMLRTDKNQKILNNRKELTYDEYEMFYNFKLPTNGITMAIPQFNYGSFYFESFDKHKRIYKRKYEN